VLLLNDSGDDDSSKRVMNNKQGCEVGPGANGTGSSEIQPENLPRRVSLPSRGVQSKEVKIKLAHTSVFFINKNFWMKKSPLSKGKRNPSFTLLMLHLIAEPPVKLINVYGLCVCTKKPYSFEDWNAGSRENVDQFITSRAKVPMGGQCRRQARMKPLKSCRQSYRDGLFCDSFDD
jgi:hypothetical protein